MFIEDETDVQIAQLLFNYFYAIQVKWPDAWNNVRPSNILNKSTGFVALMRFFKDVYLSFGNLSTIVSKEQFQEIFTGISLTEAHFTTENYKPVLRVKANCIRA